MSESLQLEHFGSQKKDQIVLTKHVSRAHNVCKCVCGLRSLQHSPRPPAGFQGSLRGMKGRAGWKGEGSGME